MGFTNIRKMKSRKNIALFMLIFIFSLMLLMLFGCSKEVTQNEYTKTTYTNYSGYWNYCHYQTNEIDSELKFFKSERVVLFENEVIRDTTYCKSFNCPRNGTMQYLIRVTIE